MIKPSESSDKVFANLKSKDYNNECFDCHSHDSNWCSVNHGIFVCLKCAGVHRGLGVHISYVKSVSMDSWSHKHLRMMMMGGNKPLQEFFDNFEVSSLSIKDKYRTKAAYYYREMLKTTSEGLFYELPRPSLEDGKAVVEEEKRQMPAKNVEKQEKDEKNDKDGHKIKEFVGDAIEKTKDFGKNIKEIVSDLSIDDVENVAKSAYHSIESKVESWNFKENLRKMKMKTESYYHSMTETAKKAVKRKKSPKFIDDSKLEENEDELLLDPQRKHRPLGKTQAKM